MMHTVNILAGLLEKHSHPPSEWTWVQACLIGLGANKEEALDIAAILGDADLVDTVLAVTTAEQQTHLLDLADHALYYYCTVGVSAMEHVKHLHTKAKSYPPLANFIVETCKAVEEGEFVPWTRPPCEQAGQQEV